MNHHLTESMAYCHDKILFGITSALSGSILWFGAVFNEGEARWLYLTAAASIMMSGFLSLVFRRPTESIRLVAAALTVTDTATSTGVGDRSMSLDISAGGVTIGASLIRENLSRKLTWIGLDRDLFDGAVGANALSSASRAFASAVTGHTIVAETNSNIYSCAAVCISYS